MHRKVLFLLLIVISTTTSFGQRIKIDKKKLAFLKEETKVAVKLTFPEDLIIYSLHPEKEFIENMKKKYDRKDNGNGDKWYQTYQIAKKETWRDAFLTGLNERVEKYSDLKFVATEEETDYTLIVEADWIYTGYGGSASVGREEGKLETTLRFVKTSDQNTEIYATQAPKVIGNYAYGEFGDIERIRECYNKLGYLLSLQLKRLLK
ncbi:hypothetical protein [Aquimarina litoralis]|uniref:hypothetical protein n=1 Tax=Aquimarina litoralis TaxID=584605 RepID=UPI001C56FADC|nr:hypothetical protein [Aquimarina litoralis]MBW1294496.1 hypothetical protein [Aquimarina litoralis]